MKRKAIRIVEGSDCESERLPLGSPAKQHIMGTLSMVRR